MPDQHHNHTQTARLGKWTHLWHVVEVSVGIAALCGILGGGLGEFLRYHEVKTAERQAEAVIEASKLQEKILRAQLGTALIPSLMKGTPREREAALLILSTAAPDLAANLVANAKTPQERQLAEELEQRSIGAKAAEEFNDRLSQARIYQGFQLFGQADREYIRAAERNPDHAKASTAVIEDAKSKYAAGSYEEAARLFDEAFTNAPKQ
jgi:tetratricopeptide (TPR) repeat protein